MDHTSKVDKTPAGNQFWNWRNLQTTLLITNRFVQIQLHDYFSSSTRRRLKATVEGESERGKIPTFDQLGHASRKSLKSMVKQETEPLKRNRDLGHLAMDCMGRTLSQWVLLDCGVGWVCWLDRRIHGPRAETVGFVLLIFWYFSFTSVSDIDSSFIYKIKAIK